jgi:hypothetical protein
MLSFVITQEDHNSFNVPRPENTVGVELTTWKAGIKLTCKKVVKEFCFWLTRKCKTNNFPYTVKNGVACEVGSAYSCVSNLNTHIKRMEREGGR